MNLPLRCESESTICTSVSPVSFARDTPLQTLLATPHHTPLHTPLATPLHRVTDHRRLHDQEVRYVETPSHHAPDTDIWIRKPSERYGKLCRPTKSVCPIVRSCNPGGGGMGGKRDSISSTKKMSTSQSLAGDQNLLSHQHHHHHHHLDSCSLVTPKRFRRKSRLSWFRKFNSSSSSRHRKHPCTPTNTPTTTTTTSSSSTSYCCCCTSDHWDQASTAACPVHCPQSLTRCIHCDQLYRESDNAPGNCLDAPDKVSDWLSAITCLSCAHVLLYHCTADSEGDYSLTCPPCTSPCSSVGSSSPPASTRSPHLHYPPRSNASSRSYRNHPPPPPPPPLPHTPHHHSKHGWKRWLIVAVMSIFVPCLCCYPVLSACHRGAMQCHLYGPRHAAKVH